MNNKLSNRGILANRKYCKFGERVIKNRAENVDEVITEVFPLSSLKSRNRLKSRLDSLLNKKDEYIGELAGLCEERLCVMNSLEKQIVEQKSLVARLEIEKTALTDRLAEIENECMSLRDYLVVRDREYISSRDALHRVENSRAWKSIEPVRTLSRNLRKVKSDFFRLRALPLANITVGDRKEKGHWVALSADPQIELLPLAESLPKGWVYIEFSFYYSKGLTTFELYFDIGYGYTPQSQIVFPIESGRQKALIYIPKDCVAIRLDPISSLDNFIFDDVLLIKADPRSINQKYISAYRVLLALDEGTIEVISAPDCAELQRTFNDSLYLKANPDVQTTIERGDYRNPWDHFIRSGILDVFAGTRVLYPLLPTYSEKLYMDSNPDVAGAFKSNRIVSVFVHYLTSGSIEMLKGIRAVEGEYPNIITQQALKFLGASFNEAAYLAVNQDASALVHSGAIKSGYEHFLHEGEREIASGKRVIYKRVPLFDAERYISAYPDVRDALVDGIFASPYEHFIMHGATEIYSGARPLPFSGEKYLYVEPKFDDVVNNELNSLTSTPLISIVMPVYNVEPSWLEKAVESIKNQWYPNWELCIADDCSTNPGTIRYLRKLVEESDKIKILFSKENGNISACSNAALSMAKGEYVALMDNDDELTPEALFEVVKAINSTRAEFIYSDEDKISMKGHYVEPHFKPDFSPDMLLAHNYISHLGVIKKTLVDKVGGWRVGFEGAQDYDLYLRVLEHTERIAHIPKVLYHWRKIPGSTAAEFSDKSYAQEAGRKALEEALRRRNIAGKAINGITGGTYRVKYEIKGEPLVSIVIPFRDKPELLKQCLNSILDRSTYRNFEIICMDNGSVDPEVERSRSHYVKTDKRVRFYDFDEPFNYSRINNVAVNQYCQGEFIVLLNNDIEIITSDWIQGMLEHAQRRSVGAVGVKLLYPNDTIQHAGLVICPDTGHAVTNVHKHFARDSYGYFSRLQAVCNYSAVTAAMLMIEKSKFSLVDGFDEEKLKVAYNDVDLCLKLLGEGYHNIYTPFVSAYHHESASRGFEDSPDKLNRMRAELYALKSKHPGVFSRTDRYYGPNLSQFSEKFAVDKSCSELFETVKPKRFEQCILIEKTFRKITSSVVSIFVHYDKDGLIDNYVLNYLNDLSVVSDVVFVSTSERLSAQELGKLSPYVTHAIVKENYGYDFGAWKTGLEYLGETISSLDKLILCNDSVYGPMTPISELLSKMDEGGYQVFGVTDSYEIQYHIQSYFVIYDRSALQCKAFSSFWENFVIYEDKWLLILNSELGLSQRLIDSGLSIGACAPASQLGYLNNTHYKWKECLAEYGAPFVKVELLKKNPMNMDLTEVKKYVESETSYSYELISSHLDRF